MDPAAKAFKTWAATHVPKKRKATKQDGLDFFLANRQKPYMQGRGWLPICVILSEAGLVIERKRLGQ